MKTSKIIVSAAEPMITDTLKYTGIPVQRTIGQNAVQRVPLRSVGLVDEYIWPASSSIASILPRSESVRYSTDTDEKI